MYKKLVALILASASVLITPVHAEMKIVLVDGVRAILSTTEAQTLVEAFQKEIDAETTALQAKAKKFRELQEKAQRDAEILTKEDARRIQKDLEDLGIEIDFERKHLQKDANDKQQEILRSLQPRYQKVLKDLIDIDQIDLVLPTTSAVYSNPIHDITRRVTEKMNDEASKSAE